MWQNWSCSVAAPATAPVALKIIITMELLLRAAVFLWISFGFLYLLEKSEACPGNNFSMMCEFMFRNVCYEFVGESQTWSQARSSCGKRGGELLTLMNSPVMNFLTKTSKRNLSNFTWWLGEGVQGDYQGPVISE